MPILSLISVENRRNGQLCCPDNAAAECHFYHEAPAADFGVGLEMTPQSQMRTVGQTGKSKLYVGIVIICRFTEYLLIY